MSIVSGNNRTHFNKKVHQKATTAVQSKEQIQMAKIFFAETPLG